MPQVRESAPTLSLEKVRSSPDGIALAWFVLQATFRCFDDDLLSPMPIAGFTLERQEAGSSRWTMLAAGIPAAARRYVDRGVEPGIRYLYRVTALLADGTSLATQTEEPVAGPPRWRLSFSRPSKPAGAAKGAVYVTIEKFEKGVGTVASKHVHQDGDSIGWWEETSGVGPTPQHPVTLPDGKELTIDFNSGAILETVVPMKQIVEIKRCRPVYDLRSGDQVGCDPIVEQRPFECHEISYEDAEGKHRVDVPELTSLNQLCRMHLANPNVPPGEPRLLEALTLLHEADRLWDIDSAASIKLYQRLQKDYKDVVIRLQVRNKVEGRARQADDP